MVEALKTAREDLSPLTLNHPTLVDTLKTTMGSIAAPLQADALQAEQLELASRLHTALAVRTQHMEGAPPCVPSVALRSSFISRA